MTEKEKHDLFSSLYQAKSLANLIELDSPSEEVKLLIIVLNNLEKKLNEFAN